jgi:hypothetical protein
VRNLFVVAIFSVLPDAWSVAIPANPWWQPSPAWAAHQAEVLSLGLSVLMMSPMIFVAPSALAAHPDMAERTFAVTKLLYRALFTPPISREWSAPFVAFMLSIVVTAPLAPQAVHSGLLWAVFLLIGGLVTAFGLAFFFEGVCELTGLGPPLPVRQSSRALLGLPRLSA